VEPGQELLRKWEAHAGRSHPRMEITSGGLMLGAGTLLAKMAQDERGRPRLGIDDEPRAVALLATAYERPVDPYVLTKMHRACELWNVDEKALAHIHLAHANLPHCDETRALRLFVADALLEVVTPSTLMKAQGFDTAFLKIFHPDELRVPAGNRRESGEWTDGGAVTPASFRTRGRIKALSTFLEWLRGHFNGSTHESPPEKAPPAHEDKKPASQPLEAERPSIIDTNKLHHIFDNPRHPFGDFVSQYGSREAAFQAIEDATGKAVREQHITTPYKIEIELGGRKLIVKGTVLPNGTVKIGTAYPWNN